MMPVGTSSSCSSNNNTGIIDHQQIEKTERSVSSPFTRPARSAAHHAPLLSLLPSASLPSAANVGNVLKVSIINVGISLMSNFSEGCKAARSVCRIDFDMRGRRDWFWSRRTLSWQIIMWWSLLAIKDIQVMSTTLKSNLVSLKVLHQCFPLPHIQPSGDRRSEPEDLDFMVLKPQSSRHGDWPD